ncbi:uncharacterized protein LOC135433330 [Drosophila montana]|uniref:uncharacterized protein LOC135433330 n=1 Tax=Drosophila montana TaxID=40370 RepID=UPI00313B01BB
MDRVCRVCMCSKDLVDIFAEGKLSDCELTLAEMLNECVKHQVKPTDKLTKKICRSCISDVKIANRLKRNAENSHKRLNNSLQETDLEEFIETLEAEDWELVPDPIKKELEELEVHLESPQESHSNQTRALIILKDLSKAAACHKLTDQLLSMLPKTTNMMIRQT